MYSVTDAFKQIASRTNAAWQRKFTIGSSDYSDDVLKWPTIERRWDDVSPLTITIELSNEDRMFNFFMQDKTLLHNQCAIQLGLPIGMNLLKYSQEFNNASGWTASNCTVTANSTLAPDGTMTADTLTDATAAAFGSDSQSVTVPNDSASYVLSVYVKKTTGGTAPILGINFGLAGGTAVTGNIRFNSDTGGSSGTATIIDEGSYWRIYRSIANNSSGNTSCSINIYPASGVSLAGGDTATATGSAVLWGMQLEIGTVPTTYNLTVGSALSSSTTEYITPFSGTIDAVRYTGGKVSMTLVDKFKQLSDRVIADTTTPQSYTSSSYMVHDLAWFICTSHGGFSALTSTSNPDIDYQSFSSWTSVFSADNVRMQAQFTGQKPMEALKKIALLTQSAIWIENDKIKFIRFSLTGSATATLNDAGINNAEHILDDRELINTFHVGANYDITSRSHGITVSESSSSSISRYGLREDNSMENYIWLVDSVSALNLAQRIINTKKEITGGFTINAPLHSVASTIGDTIVYVDSLLQINDTFRIMGETLDLDTGTKVYAVDQTQIMNGFILDVTSLDGTEILT